MMRGRVWMTGCRLGVQRFFAWSRPAYKRPTEQATFSVGGDGEEFDHAQSISFTDGSAQPSDYQISPPTLINLERIKITALFPVQITCFKPVFAGQNVIAKDKTGSGKTLAYALPLVEKLRQDGCFRKANGQHPLLLIMVPTRELATQITEEFLRLRNFPGEYSIGCFFGGTSMGNQCHRLRSGVEVVVATPGRMLALIDAGELKLDEIKAVVLDETDQMLDMGFKDSVETLFRELASAGRRSEDVQHLLFSATMPAWIREMSRSFLKDNFVYVNMLKGQSAVTPPDIRHLSAQIYTPKQQLDAIPLLIKRFCSPKGQCIVFSETKGRAQEVFEQLALNEPRALLTGNVGPYERRRTFEQFKRNEIKCLVATDLASRGLDFPNVELIIILSAPQHFARYIHRAGRAGRAGKKGVCVTLYYQQEEEIMRKLEQQIKVSFEKLDVEKLRSKVEQEDDT